MVFNFDKMYLDGHNDNLFRVSIALNELRNVLITPAAYLFGGKTVTCYRFKIEGTDGNSISQRVYSDLKDSYSKDQKNIFKTLLAITCLVPTVFAYLIVCPLTMLCSDNLYRRLCGFQEYKKDPYAFSKISSEKLNVNVVHECPLFVEIKDKILVAIWHKDTSMAQRALESIEECQRDQFAAYYHSLPIEEKAAPMQEGSTEIWYSLKSLDIQSISFQSYMLSINVHRLNDIHDQYSNAP